MKLVATLALTSCAALAACKPAANGGNMLTAKTLDNFARPDGSSVTTYFCGVNMTKAIYAQLAASDRHVVDTRIQVEGRGTAAEKEEWKLAAAGALAAAPKAMQTVFLAGKGTIRVVDDAAGACAKAGLTSAEKKFAAESTGSAATPVDGCWDKSRGVLDVVVKKDKTAIHHGLLRLLTFVYTQLFVAHASDNADVPAALRDAVNAGVDRFKKQRYALSVALLQDLYAKNQVTQAKAFETYAKSDRDGFENRVFTEVVDSAYCSASSRSVFESDFKKTWTAFASGKDSLLADFGQPLY